ncbi:TatD family hydrolase [Salinisphaera sp. T31B1]|uniref:TatD family hydrolase n=1 Tax=Salinisphaera sp. T31B1 TaxID=727963 RepID=UPI00333EE660
MQLTDIGANLAHESFDDDRDAVIDRAQAAGIERLIVTGSDAASNAHAIDLAARHGSCFATAGLHPHHAAEWSDTLLSQIDDAAARGAIVAVGETGLDFFRDISPRDRQEQVFAEQLDIACRHRLPAFLHQRDAHERFLPILEAARPRLSQAVVHCFTDSHAALDAYLALDVYIGITGWVCDERRGRTLYDLVARIPDDRLLIETDCPYLMPRTIRPRPKTRRNEPANLPWVLATVAAARHQTPEHVAAATHANAARLFGLTDQ